MVEGILHGEGVQCGLRNLVGRGGEASGGGSQGDGAEGG